MAKLDQIFIKAAEIGASDVHISVNNPPLFRHLGELKKFKAPPLTALQTKALLYEILTPKMKERLEEDLQLDFSYEIQKVARFRVNVFNQRLGVDASFRIVPFKIPSFEELGLPAVIRKIMDNHQGLILVTGATGHPVLRQCPEGGLEGRPGRHRHR